MKLAAERKGLRTNLTAVEGSEKHCKFIRQHMTDNGLVDADIRVLNVAVSARDGVEIFTDVGDAREIYGAQILESKNSTARGSTVKAVSFRRLLTEHKKTDIIHCDVQGAEADIFESAFDELSTRVRRVVIGTHGREIEGRLIKLFSDKWVLEHEAPCGYSIVEGRPCLISDGVQIWSNPRAL